MSKGVQVTCDGQQFASIKSMCDRYGADRGKVTRRLNQGWTPEQAVGLVIRRKRGSAGKPLVFEGVRYDSLVDAAAGLGLNPKLVASRVASGYSAEDALRGNLKGKSASRGKPVEYAAKVFPSHEQLCAAYGQTWRTVQKRIGRGWTMEQALDIEPAPPRFRNFEGHARDHKWKEVRLSAGRIEPVPDVQGYKLYVVTNIVNGRAYVGLTITSLDQRLKQHFAAARRGRKSAFANAMNKYGERAFRIDLIRSDAKTYEELQAQEVLEIAERDAIRSGYNTAKGGSIGTTKEIAVDGKLYQSYAGAAEAFGVDPGLFALRVARLKWTPEEAVGLVLRRGSGNPTPVKINGSAFPSLAAAAIAYGVKKGTVHSRFHVKGWTIEQSLGVEPPPERTRVK